MHFTDNIETTWTRYYSAIEQFSKKTSYIPSYYTLWQWAFSGLEAANFHILLITGLHAEAVSMGGAATGNGVCSSPHLLSKCFTQGTITSTSRDDNLNLPIQMGILRLSFNSFIADCLRSYLITFSLPTHFQAMKNWNQEKPHSLD